MSLKGTLMQQSWMNWGKKIPWDRASIVWHPANLTTFLVGMATALMPLVHKKTLSGK